MSLNVMLVRESSFCPHCLVSTEGEILYEANITHNLGTMAKEVGIYKALWRPEEEGWIHARDIISVVSKGLTKLKADPEWYSQFNSPNGWGMYEHFVPFVEKYLEALIKYPNTIIQVDR